jgi:exodeoxyribonuclease VII large subunit
LAASDALTVSQLARAIRGALERSFPREVWLRGEVSNLRAYNSGHWYFTLKDREAQLSLAMFSRANRRVRFKPKDGDEVVVRGRIDVYAARGDLQIIAEEMLPLGSGRLQAEFERLKARLAAEGLFDDERKQPLPAVPRRIGIVTSEKAAALQDMLRVLRERDPTLSITLAPSRVQGQGSGESVAAALDLLNRQGRVEVILCGRGGGSIEDLWAFNEEVVARAIARSTIPVISGVGHEIDVTIADFVADARAPTPTAAAEMAVAVRSELEAAVLARLRRLRAAWTRSAGLRRRRVGELDRRLLSPRRRLDRDAQRLDDARLRLAHAATRRLQRDRTRSEHARSRLASASPARELTRARGRALDLQRRLGRGGAAVVLERRRRLESLRRALLALGPLSILDRGFAIATGPDGAVLEEAASVAVGDAVQVRLRRGALECRVDGVRTELEPRGGEPQ